MSKLLKAKLTRIAVGAVVAACSSLSLSAQDKQADNMLVYQRSWGGWPKHIGNVKIDYTKTLTEVEKKAIIADSLRKDPTIDNGATVKEIRYLARAYKQYNNPAYKAAVDKGIRYLLKAQYPLGGWPQFYPDSSLYRGQITYNDNAIANVLNLLMDASLGLKDMDVVDPSLQPAIKDAIARGVDGLVLTQVKVNGKGTGWGAQHDQRTLKPTNARKFEPASLSGMETVGLVQVLMRVEQPSEKVKQAINDAVNWLTSVQIKGYTYLDIEDASQPKGKDRIIKPDANSTIWARFYDLETNQPIFSGRDGEKKKNLNEIEVERRVGYAWYGVWPKKLIEKDYPTWLKKNEGIANKN